MAAHAKAIEDARGARHGATLQRVLTAYQDSVEFRDLAPRTKADYAKQIRKIEAEFGTLPLAALAERGCRGEFKAWRDKLATSRVGKPTTSSPCSPASSLGGSTEDSLKRTHASAPGASTHPPAPRPSGRLTTLPASRLPPRHRCV